MGSGKSTVARRLSQCLSIPWVEMDALVYQKTETKNMHEVFAKGGEFLLRTTEIAIAQEYASQKNLIISTGGGVVLNKIILDFFKQAGGKVIFLNATFDTLAKRLEKDEERPLFKKDTNTKKLYEFRWPLYVNYADEILNVDNQSVDDIVKGVLNGL